MSKLRTLGGGGGGGNYYCYYVAVCATYLISFLFCAQTHDVCLHLRLAEL